MTMNILASARLPKSAAQMTGVGLIALALYFNLPFARLATIFDYPGILREPTEKILAAFAAGGTELILVWYGFALAAMLFMPAALAHALGNGRVQRLPAFAISAAVIGVLAGLTQAMGLLRWVMVVPLMAQSLDANGMAGDFTLIHAYAGVALGEHLGMLLTAFHVALMTAIQRREGSTISAGLGVATAIAIGLGAFEGVAMAIGADGSLFAMASISGYLLLTVWLIWSGVGLLRR